LNRASITASFSRANRNPYVKERERGRGKEKEEINGVVDMETLKIIVDSFK